MAQALLFPEEAFPITDISGTGSFDFGMMEKPQGIVIHHTGGGGTPDGIMDVFKQRGLATQFIMDREGNVFRSLPEGMRGQHIRPSQINGLTNSNTLGIEIIAKDDNDLTDAQKAAASKWLTHVGNQYGIPAANVFGHGEINSHKQATEGSTIVNAWRTNNRVARPDLGPAASGGDLPMSQRTLMAYAGRDAPRRQAASPNTSQYDAIYAEASKETGIPVAILKAQTQQESGFDPTAIGRSGEVGLLQIKPSTASQPGFGVQPVDPRRLADPAENIRFGARYLAARARAAGVENWNDPAQVAKGLTAYNGGGDPNYAQNVLRYLRAPGQAETQVASSPPQRTPPLNPQITAAAERGRGPIADRVASGGAYVSQMPTEPPPMPDLSNSNDAGLRALIAQAAGGMPQGGLGGLGGFVIPEGGSAAQPAAAAGGGGGLDIGTMLQAIGMSLLSGDRRNPFKNFGTILNTLQTAATGQAKTAQEQAALASALKMGGMTDQQARLYAVNPAAAKIALDEVQRQKAVGQEAEFNSRIAGIGQGQPAQSKPADNRAFSEQYARAGELQQSEPQTVPPQAQPPSPTTAPQMPAPATSGQSAQPSAFPVPQQQSQPFKLDTGNRTVDTLFGRRLTQVQEYDALARQLAAAPTDRAKNMVENRMKAVEKQIGQTDKQIDQYSPTQNVREYGFAMSQRQAQGLPVVPFEKWDPAADRKAAAGPSADDAANLRKEVQSLPSYKNVAQAAPVYRSMLDAAGRDDRASDVNLIYGMAKLMDPGSVVRESEMTVAQAIATLPQQIQNNIKSQLVQSGRLSPDVREGLMREAYSRMTAYNQLFDQDAGQYRGIVGRRGMNEADVLPSFGTFEPFQSKREKEARSSGTGQAPAAPDYRLVDQQYVRPDGSSPPVPQIPRAATKAERDKLAPGSLYIDAEGNTRRVRGN